MKRILILSSLFTLLLTGCKDSEGLQSNGNIREVKASFFDWATTRVSLESDVDTRDMITKWQADDRISIIVTKGVQRREIGTVPIHDVATDGKSCTFQYAMPEDIDDLSKGYQLSCFTSNCEPKIMNDDVYINASIVRMPISQFKARVFSDQYVNEENSFATFNHYGTYEILHIKNKTDRSISFSLNGFSADLRWYRESGAIRLVDKQFFSDLSYERMDKSPSVSIPSNGSDMIVSWYVPNGQKIADASLVAEIDGKNIISTNTITSGVTLCTGIAYHMYATWDGKVLKFDKGDVATESTIFVGPSEIVFGDAQIGETKKEYLTISNSGEEDKEVKVAIEGHGPYDGPFELPDALLWDDYVTLTVPPGESRNVEIKFSSGTAGDYSGSLIVTSEGILQGSYVVPLKGKVLEEDKSFHLSTNYLEMYVNTEKAVDIKNGSGDYDVVNKNPDIVDYDINGIHVARARKREPTEHGEDIKDDHLWITAKKVGTATLKLTDKRSKEELTLNVRVTRAPSLALARNSVEMSVGGKEYVEILSGSGWYEVTTDNPSVVSASVSTISIGGGGRREEQGTTYTATAFDAVIEALSAGKSIVTVKDLSSGEIAKINVTVNGNVIAYTSCPDSHHPHLIDLGLPSGTKWACCNVGAEKPEDYGGYFAWGETTEKSYYDWDTYTHCDGSKETCHDIGKDIAGTQYDAATANWGSPWVMPSKDQIIELKNNCASEWTEENSVTGRRFTSTNGASIFLPAAGHRSNGDLWRTGGYYRSSTLNESDTSDVYELYFFDGYVGPTYGFRYGGLSVRPVRKN